MTTPLDRTHLPLPDTPTGGKAGRTVAESVMPTIQPIRPPAGAPNIVIVLLDDVGFGATATFGGPVPTPVGRRPDDGGQPPVVARLESAVALPPVLVAVTWTISHWPTSVDVST